MVEISRDRGAAVVHRQRRGNGANLNDRGLGLGGGGALSGHFRCGEASAVEFEEQDANHETGALVAIDERMVAHDACRIGCCQVEEVGRIGIGVKLLRASKRGIQQGVIPHTGRAAVQREQAIMEGKCIPRVDLEQLGHWARIWSVWR